jgi:MYXO-CTERM domain-containing protein
VAGTACAPATGACGDPSCGGPCPAGTFCDQGTCKDACAGAVCPTGQVCTAGACVPASNGSDGGVGGGGADQPGGNNAHFDESGCGCGPTARAGSPGTSKMASLFALLLLGLVRRRRR